VYKSFEDERFPPKKDKTILVIEKGGYVLRESEDEDGNPRTHASGYLLINPKVNVGLTVIKPFISRYYRANYNTMFKTMGKFYESGENKWEDYDVKVFD